MDNSIGEIIRDYRAKQRLTQDELGHKYNTSGPGIFKFERGYIRPNLTLWLRMSQDIGIPERKAVLMHVRSRLPNDLQSIIDPDSKPKARKRSVKGLKDYKSISGAKELKAAARRDTGLPKALRDLLAEDSLWKSFKPTGKEIETLRDKFGSLGRGSKNSYREALRLIRGFIDGV